MRHGMNLVGILLVTAASFFLFDTVEAQAYVPLTTGERVELRELCADFAGWLLSNAVSSRTLLEYEEGTQNGGANAVNNIADGGYCVLYRSSTGSGLSATNRIWVNNLCDINMVPGCAASVTNAQCEVDKTTCSTNADNAIRVEAMEYSATWSIAAETASAARCGKFAASRMPVPPTVVQTSGRTCTGENQGQSNRVAWHYTQLKKWSITHATTFIYTATESMGGWTPVCSANSGTQNTGAYPYTRTVPEGHFFYAVAVKNPASGQYPRVTFTGIVDKTLEPDTGVNRGTTVINGDTYNWEVWLVSFQSRGINDTFSSTFTATLQHVNILSPGGANDPRVMCTLTPYEGLLSAQTRIANRATTGGYTNTYAEGLIITWSNPLYKTNLQVTLQDFTSFGQTPVYVENADLTINGIQTGRKTCTSDANGLCEIQGVYDQIVDWEITHIEYLKDVRTNHVLPSSCNQQNTCEINRILVPPFKANLRIIVHAISTALPTNKGLTDVLVEIKNEHGSDQCITSTSDPLNGCNINDWKGRAYTTTLTKTGYATTKFDGILAITCSTERCDLHLHLIGGEGTTIPRTVEVTIEPQTCINLILPNRLQIFITRNEPVELRITLFKITTNTILPAQGAEIYTWTSTQPNTLNYQWPTGPTDVIHTGKYLLYVVYLAPTATGDRIVAQATIGINESCIFTTSTLLDRDALKIIRDFARDDDKALEAASERSVTNYAFAALDWWWRPTFPNVQFIGDIPNGVLWLILFATPTVTAGILTGRKA